MARAKIEPHFLVVEYNSAQQVVAKGINNNQLGSFMLSGSTCDEMRLREWVNQTWGERASPALRGMKGWNPKLKMTSSLKEIIKACAKGGWVVYETPGIDTELT